MLTELVAKLSERLEELLAVVQQKKRLLGAEPLPTLTEKQRDAYKNRPLPKKPAAPAKPLWPTVVTRCRSNCPPRGLPRLRPHRL